MRSARLILAWAFFLIALGWCTFWATILLYYYTRPEGSTNFTMEFYHVPPGSCDTDTDCMNKFGGDGGPAPIRKSEWHNEDSHPITSW